MTDLVTGEAVVLDVRTARLPSRMLALAFDIFLIQFPLLGLIAYLGGRLGNIMEDALTQAIGLVLGALVIVGYPAALETLWRGRTLGKAVAGLRIVGDDGGPERFRQALFRSLVAFVEIWVTFGIVALFTSLFSRQGRRLGDIFAGTIAVRERMPVQGGAVAVMPPQLAGWAAGAELTGVSDDLALHARQFLSRYENLTPAAREDMARRLASAMAERVSPAPPAGTPAVAYISAVLAERRRRAGERHAAKPYGRAPIASHGHPAPGMPGQAAQPWRPSGYNSESVDGQPAADGRAQPQHDGEQGVSGQNPGGFVPPS